MRFEVLLFVCAILSFHNHSGLLFLLPLKVLPVVLLIPLIIIYLHLLSMIQSSPYFAASFPTILFRHSVQSLIVSNSSCISLFRKCYTLWFVFVFMLFGRLRGAVEEDFCWHYMLMKSGLIINHSNSVSVLYNTAVELEWYFCAFHFAARTVEF